MSAIVFSSKPSSGVVESLALGLLHKELREVDGRYASFRITRIVHYKDKTTIGHEFLVLHLTNGQEEIVVRIERRPSTRKVAVSSEVQTDDSISPLESDFDPNNYYLISTTLTGLTVLDMCIICAAIRKAAPTYGVLRKGRHCYWFCAAFLYWVRHTRHTIFCEGQDYEKKGRFIGIKLISERSIRRRFPAGDLPPYRWSLEGCLVGHTDWARSVQFTPDGRRILSTSGDKTIRIWDACTLTEARKPLEGHSDAIESIALSPDGRRIVSGGRDNTVRIWELEAGVPVTEPLEGHTGWVRSVAFSPDGHKIVSGSNDKSVRIWDAETGAAVGEPLLGHDREVFSVAWSPDGSRIVSGSVDATIRVWDEHTRMLTSEPFRGHNDSIFDLAISPDGTRVVSGSYDKTVRIWDIARGCALGEPLRGHTESICSVAISPDGRWIASGANDQTVRIWDSEAGGEDGEIGRLDAGFIVYWVAWSPSCDRIAAACQDKKVRIWRRTTS